MRTNDKKDKPGFTIVELLIVIVVIAILAAISIVAYNGIQERARDTKIQSDLATLSKAIQAARVNESKTLYGVTGVAYTAVGCASKTAGTDLAGLSKTTDTCWTTYIQTLTRVSNASGMTVTNLVDPWGRPYFIDENEGESAGNCGRDIIGVYAYPAAGAQRTNAQNIPLSGFSGCAL